MISIRLSPSHMHAEHEAVSRSFEGYFRCPSGRESDLSGVPHLEITPERLPEPFRVYPDRGVVVSTWEGKQVCAYTGIRLDRYVLIASLLALSQWRVLRQNPLLQLEDLIHPAGVHCMYAGPRTVQDFALLLDPPVICGGCVDFYHCLGADSELIALQELIAEVKRSSSG